MILGIDEAGRGPVMGPLVLCGIWLRRPSALRDLDVRDSKLYGSGERARQQRRRLASQIRQRAAHVVLLSVEAPEVDRRVAQGQLNQLEQELARTVIQAGPPTRRIVADGARLFSPLTAQFSQLTAEDRADQNWPVVAAASVLAKDRRDQRFAELVAPHQEQLGPVRGGGYANRATEAFLRAYFERHNELPPGVRRSWSWSVLQELEARQLMLEV